jgi:hypothetical protein
MFYGLPDSRPPGAGADRQKGFFVAVDYTSDAILEIDAYFRKADA